MPTVDDDGMSATTELGALVRDWLDRLGTERDASEQTLVAYRRDMIQFLGWLTDDLGHPPSLADVGRLDVS